MIELLSPSNKLSGRPDYVEKRRDYLAAGVNVVELDLLRRGYWAVDLPGEWTEIHEKKRDCELPYVICVRRPDPGTQREVYFCALQEPLPVIRIPLRPTDPDVTLDIQAQVDRCYQTGRYWRLDYGADLDPPASEADSKWMDELLKRAELRS